VKFFRHLLVAAAVSTVALAVPQDATPEQRGKWPVTNEYATLHFDAGIGSFRNIDSKGRLDVSFKGTLLVNKLKKGGTITATGNLKKEYEGLDRVIYTGQGRIVVDGEWRVVQWFGTNLTGVWYGRGLMRVIGEFDKNLNTGHYWYTDPTNKVVWFATSTMVAELPSRQMMQGSVKPKRKPMSDY
jgi:hypothetical protein